MPEALKAFSLFLTLGLPLRLVVLVCIRQLITSFKSLPLIGLNQLKQFCFYFSSQTCHPSHNLKAMYSNL